MQTTVDFESIFKNLNIPIPNITKNYSPDEYGRMLIAGAFSAEDIRYSYSSLPVDESMAADSKEDPCT